MQNKIINNLVLIFEKLFQHLPACMGGVIWEGEGGFRGREKNFSFRNINKTKVGFYSVYGFFLKLNYWGGFGLKWV